MPCGNFHTKVRVRTVWKTLLIKTKLREQASCPPPHSKVMHKIFWMGRNLRRYGMNQRTMGLVEQKISQPQYSTHHPKKLQMPTPPGRYFLLLCQSLLEPLGGGRSKLSPDPRWRLRFVETLVPTALTSSSEGINLPLYSGSNLPTERNLSLSQIREFENLGKVHIVLFQAS